MQNRLRRNLPRRSIVLQILIIYTCRHNDLYGLGTWDTFTLQKLPQSNAWASDSMWQEGVEKCAHIPSFLLSSFDMWRKERPSWTLACKSDFVPIKIDMAAWKSNPKERRPKKSRPSVVGRKGETWWLWFDHGSFPITPAWSNLTMSRFYHNCLRRLTGVHWLPSS